MSDLKRVIDKLKNGFLKKVTRELKWIYRLLKKRRRTIVGYTLLMLLSTVLGLFLSVQLRDAMDSIITGAWQNVIRVGVLCAVLGAVNIAFSMWEQRISGRISANVRTELSCRAYDAIMNADWQTVTEHHSGDLMVRMMEDIAAVAGSTVGWIPLLLAQTVQCVASAVIVLYHDLSMIFIVAVAMPLLMLGARGFLVKMYESNRDQRRLASDIMSDYKESFQHLQSIKSFGLTDRFSRRMTARQKEREANDLVVNKYSIASWGTMYISCELAALACLLLAIYHVYTGKLTPGTMVLMFVLANNIGTSLKTLILQIPAAINTISSSERLRNLLEMKKEEIDNVEAYDRMLAESPEGVSLTVRNMSFCYEDGGETPVFRNVQYDVGAGEIVAFVGPSGEGKTTMLRVLLGIVEAQGELTLHNGHADLPVSQASRRLMAYVPQGNSMLRGTIAENLRLLRPEATDEEIIEALQEACAYEFVSKLPDGIYHNIGESGIGFSEGQNQRLAIARALMCRAPMILLDEATSALDVATERRVLKNLMQGKYRRTCILTTHRPSVLSMCDRVYRIADQTVREIGEAEIRQLFNEF